MKSKGLVSMSGEGLENLTAKAWGIPLHQWWQLPREVRIAHIAASVAEGIQTMARYQED